MVEQTKSELVPIPESTVHYRYDFSIALIITVANYTERAKESVEAWEEAIKEDQEMIELLELDPNPVKWKVDEINKRKANIKGLKRLIEKGGYQNLPETMLDKDAAICGFTKLGVSKENMWVLTDPTPDQLWKKMNDLC